MKKLLTTLALLTVVGTPAFAQYNPKDYQASTGVPTVQHQTTCWPATASTLSPWCQADRQLRPRSTIRRSPAVAALATTR